MVSRCSHRCENELRNCLPGASLQHCKAKFLDTATNGDKEIGTLRLLLKAQGQVPAHFITESLLPATTNGALQTVSLLMRAGANGEHEQASALMHAVETGRDDIAAAIVVGPCQPSSSSLDRAIGRVFSAATANLNSKLLLIELLLCGGPEGDAADEGLFKATMLGNVEMMQLLLEYGADVNYNNAAAVGHAIQRNRVDLLSLLLQNQTLSQEMAAEAVGRIPRSAPPAVKVAVLSKLLLYGASGVQCSELLVTAAETDDLETAKILLCYGKDNDKAPVAAVDYNAAKCLQIAVSRNNHQMVNLISLEGHPSQFSLARVFPIIQKVDKERHFLMVQALVNGGAQGPEVDSELLAEVASPRPSRKLISLLVDKGASVRDETLIDAVRQRNLDIARLLLKGAPSAAACSTAIKMAIASQDDAIGFQMVLLLLPYAVVPEADSTAIAQGLIDVLERRPKDTEMLQLLCQEGRADINFRNGQAVFLAVQNANPKVLDIVLQSRGGLPSLGTISTALASAMELPLADSHRCWKVEVLLQKGKPQETMNHALIQEIRLALAVQKDLSVIHALLAAGADVNAEDGAPVCYSVKDPNIMDIILAKRPTPYSVSRAFPLAVTLRDPQRYNLCTKLLGAGAAGDEISKALFKATKEGPSAISLMKLLLPQADVNYRDGRILRVAVREVFLEGLNLLLGQHSIMLTTATKAVAFQDAMNIKDPEKRLSVVQKLLATGIRGEVLSDALITAVNLADLHLAELLQRSGASVEHNGGQAVLSAASSGNTNMLSMLVGGGCGVRPTLSILTTGFGGAMALKDRDVNSYYLIVKILLEAGLRGEAVDVALVEAVKEGDSNLKLTELIYASGASIEWHDGEAIDIAARLASLETLSLLLGTHPSQNTLKRAFRSSLALPTDQRCEVISFIMQAGKSIDKHVSNTLLQATREQPPDKKLIKLLLDFQVFDEGQSMAHAASVLDMETMLLLLESPKARLFTSSTFRYAMKIGLPWQSQQGLSVMKLLLENGATGEAVGEALVQAVEICKDSSDIPAREFLILLLRLNPNANYQKGIVLQRLVQHSDMEIVRKLLPGANSESKAMAFPYIFKSSADEEFVLRMIEAFTESLDAEGMIDVNFKHPDLTLQPVLFMALEKFPRKQRVLKALLDAGFSPDQWHDFDTQSGVQALTVLCWALHQPEKRISSANISLLIDAGGRLFSDSLLHLLSDIANVNPPKTHTTPVMLCIQNDRPDILEKLISKGANVTSADETRISPLALASQTGNAALMGHILAAGADVDDGSLHDAARELRMDAMRILIKYGHEVDFPSPRHDGRSALAELCFKAVDNGPSPDLEEAINCLLASGADCRLRNAGGKTAFHYALDSSDPMSILKVMMKVLWKVINEDCFLFTDGQYTYSLTKYVEKGFSLGPQIQNQEVIDLLRKFRAKDRFWANSIDAVQPADYCGAPQHIEDEALRQRAREKRASEMREDMSLQVEMKRLLAIEEDKILRTRTEQEVWREFEKARAQERIMENRADKQLQLEGRAELERQRLARIKHADEVAHMKAIGNTQVSTQRDIAQARLETSQTEHMLQIEFEEARNSKMNDGVRQRLAIEGHAMEDKDRILKKHHEREMARMRTQKTLVDSTKDLANNLKSAGANQRQIGYIMGEVGN